MVGTTFGTMASLFFAAYFDAIRLGKEHFRATMSAILLALVLLRGAGYWRWVSIHAMCSLSPPSACR